MYSRDLNRCPSHVCGYIHRTMLSPSSSFANVWFQIGHVYEQMYDVSETYPMSNNRRGYWGTICADFCILEVWFDLGPHYESRNNQISDAIDAYARVAELSCTLATGIVACRTTTPMFIARW